MADFGEQFRKEKEKESQLDGNQPCLWEDWLPGSGDMIYWTMAAYLGEEYFPPYIEEDVVCSEKLLIEAFEDINSSVVDEIVCNYGNHERSELS